LKNTAFYVYASLARPDTKSGGVTSPNLGITMFQLGAGCWANHTIATPGLRLSDWLMEIAIKFPSSAALSLSTCL